MTKPNPTITLPANQAQEIMEYLLEQKCKDVMHLVGYLYNAGEIKPEKTEEPETTEPEPSEAKENQEAAE